MKTIQFKTNINCGSCLSKVSPFLNEEKEIKKWEVNLSVPDKVLTAEIADSDSGKVIAAVKKAGFQIEKMN